MLNKKINYYLEHEALDLRDANLTGSKLQWNNLIGANLQSTNLWGADLQNADLHRARLKKSQLDQLIIGEDK